ncbi:MAG: carboxylating nicotinate-nucleotide diphosphorylase [Thermodesulfobacteriota bacterium]|nr:carboxylating nicotinate-nucleotide diphosphorylase [Thermodesulfobacteriota bacterium]
MMISDVRLKELIRTALDEDMGSGDLTTSSILTGNETGVAQVISKGEIIVAGITVFREVFHVLDSSLDFEEYFCDGQPAGKGENLACVSGSLKSILLAERVALNFFQRMCGIATMTHKYVEEISGTGVKILDTRKTTPNLRSLEKYAVKTGGGSNHRFGLYDGVMIKDNHISAAGGISNAVRKVVGNIPPTVQIEVEVKNLQEVEEALASGVDIIMLDNMGAGEMEKAVSLIGGRALVEASGNITLSNVKEIAETGVDFISVGALTHSAPAADISLVFK